MRTSGWNEPRKLRANGAELHYVERGSGQALVLVHGGVWDYRCWERQLETFSREFRVISYSRRYSYPNENRVVPLADPVSAEAGDLLGLARALRLGRMHLVGHSFGALVALAAALKKPQSVRALVIAEPPLHGWLTDVPGGGSVLEHMEASVWGPTRSSFERGDIEGAIRAFTDGIGGSGSFERAPAAERAMRLLNARALHAIIRSRPPFSSLSRDEVRRLTVPALVLEGERTVRIHRLVDDEILRCVPGAKRIIIRGAGHAVARDNPRAFDEAVLGFLLPHGRPRSVVTTPPLAR